MTQRHYGPDGQPVAPPPKKPPLTALVWMLALFGIIFGGCGVLGVAGSYVSMGVSDDMVTVLLRMGGMSDMMDQMEQLEKEMGHMKGAGGESVNDLMAKAQAMSDKVSGEVVPYPDLMNAIEALLSLMALAAGIGLLQRKRWAWRMEIWFILIATVFAITAMGLSVGGVLKLYDSMMGLLYAGPPFSMPWLGSSLYMLWAGVSVILVLFHGLMIYCLCRPAVRRIYEPERYGETQ